MMTLSLYKATVVLELNMFEYGYTCTTKDYTNQHQSMFPSSSKRIEQTLNPIAINNNIPVDILKKTQLESPAV